MILTYEGADGVRLEIEGPFRHGHVKRVTMSRGLTKLLNVDGRDLYQLSHCPGEHFPRVTVSGPGRIPRTRL